MFEKLLNKLDTQGAKIQNNEDRAIAFMTDTNETLRIMRLPASASQAPNERQDQEDQDAQIPSHAKKAEEVYDGNRPSASKKAGVAQEHSFGDAAIVDRIQNKYPNNAPKPYGSKKSAANQDSHQNMTNSNKGGRRPGGPSKSRHFRASQDKYAPIGEEACFSFIRGRCAMPGCTRTHIKDLTFLKHGGCCKFYCLSECTRGATCNFHHDEACRYLTWVLLRNHKVDPARVGSNDTMRLALSYVPDDESIA